MSVEIKPFGTLPDGREVKLYILENENGLKASITDFGATLVDLITPDASGNFADINLGYDNLEGYVNDTCYFGATIGRYGNRIAGGTFELDGKVYELPKNDKGKKCLHGGTEGFNKRLWQGEVINKEGVSSVRFRLTSPDGDQGFPGLLEVACVYTLTSENGLKLPDLNNDQILDAVVANCADMSTNELRNRVLVYLGEDESTDEPGNACNEAEATVCLCVPANMSNLNMSAFLAAV